MCGFVGYIQGNNQHIDHKSLILQMAKTVAHRGPDSSGYFLDDQVAIGFQRLKIIDLSSAGDQPFVSEDGHRVLVCNGEIYNYQELRESLVAMGYVFQSHTDSEVLLHGYEAWGMDVITKCRGMFAFAIWDAEEQALYLGRDPFGIKPLYYGQASEDGTFFFGSEIKSFLPHPSFRKELNQSALLPYLTFQYSATEETFFQGIYKLEPAHWLKVQKGRVEKHTYWDFSYTDTSDATLEEIVEKIRAVMHDSVKMHQISDVEVGCFLSGGIDSSYITSLVHPRDTFTVGFQSPDGKYDESDLAEELSKMHGFHHHKKIITPEEFFSILPTIQYHMDEPQSNLSAVPLYYLAQLARQYVTVVLSGEGADEIFGGYLPYMETRNVERYKHLPLGIRRFLYRQSKNWPMNKVTSLIQRGGQRPEESFFGEAVIYEPGEASSVLRPEFLEGISPYALTHPIYASIPDADFVTQKQTLDIRIWLPGDILLKADKMSSAHSLELRVPFLDRKVMEVACEIPVQYRVHHQDLKYALRKAALEELPPAYAQRPKKGFPVPIRYWLREEKYVAPVREMFESEMASQFFQKKELLRLLDEHQSGKALNQRKIYTIYTFLLWYQEFFIKR